MTWFNKRSHNEASAFHQNFIVEQQRILWETDAEQQ